MKFNVKIKGDKSPYLLTKYDEQSSYMECYDEKTGVHMEFSTSDIEGVYPQSQEPKQVLNVTDEQIEEKAKEKFPNTYFDGLITCDDSTAEIKRSSFIDGVYFGLSLTYKEIEPEKQEAPRKITYPKDRANREFESENDCTCSDDGVCKVCMDHSQGLTDNI